MKILVKKLSETAKLPTQGSADAAGYDLYANLPTGGVKINPGEIVKIPTGLSVAPEYADVALCILPRSGLASKQGITVINSPGLVDSDYRGEIIVALVNHKETPFVIQHGDRVAQLVILPIVRAEFAEVDELDVTDRGRGGFGSTGI